MNEIAHALVLNLHQPAGNLEHLLEHNEWEAREILLAMDRIPRALWPYEDVGRVHLSLSGTLLETLSSPGFQQRVYGIVDCGSLLWQLQNQNIIDILGTGYYHPVLPLIPESDRELHVARWRGIAQHLFWRQRFDGFWPPELGFTMSLIPLLRRYGYRYVIVDSEHIEPLDDMSWQELRYRPHIAEYGGEEIVVVVRDRELSDAQESGMELGWFQSEVEARTRDCGFPPLVTTCTDGDNGGWFRNLTHEANFWGAFYQPLLEQVRHGQTLITPMHIGDYLDRHGAHGRVHVHTGAWNTGWHHGKGFVQWTGSQAQQDSLRRVADLSKLIHDHRWLAGEQERHDQALHNALDRALWQLLRAETSCNFYWGEAWVGRCHHDLDDAWTALGQARNMM